jgi:hypothetical protein
MTTKAEDVRAIAEKIRFGKYGLDTLFEAQKLIREYADLLDQQAKGDHGWVPVYGIEGFEVSASGAVRRKSTGKLLTESVSGSGYRKVTFHEDGKRAQKLVHRIVCQSFLGPQEGKEVNHIDGDKTNNQLENLEWVTRSENEIHSRYVLGNLCKPVTATNVETGERRIFQSQAQATKELGLQKDMLRKCLRGEFSQSCGWSFEETQPSPAQADPVGGVSDSVREAARRIAPLLRGKDSGVLIPDEMTDNEYVPSGWDNSHGAAYVEGWNHCRKEMLLSATDSEVVK